LNVSGTNNAAFVSQSVPEFMVPDFQGEAGWQ
jgi:hypothetical protein